MKKNVFLIILTVIVVTLTTSTVFAELDFSFEGKFGSLGTGNGEFFHPQGVATNSTHIFVADTVHKRVQIFDLSGNYVDQFGSSGTGNGEFSTTEDVAVNSTHIFVTDLYNHRVQIFDLSGNYVDQFGSSGTGNGEFNSPEGVTTNSTHIFVTDVSNHRVQIFDLSGNYVDQFGSLGTGNGEFKFPGEAVTNSTHIFVTDLFNQRVQIFDLSGNYVDQFKKEIEILQPRGIVLIGTHIVFTDSASHKIGMLDLSGNYVGGFGSKGSEEGQFDHPEGLATNGTHIFVADTGNDRIQMFGIKFTPTIQITKNTVGGDDTFDFTILGNTTASVSIPNTAINNMTTPLSVIPGNYTVTENQQLGWTLSNSDCEKNGISLGTTANFAVNKNDIVECIFENTLNTLNSTGITFMIVSDDVTATTGSTNESVIVTLRASEYPIIVRTIYFIATTGTGNIDLSVGEGIRYDNLRVNGGIVNDPDSLQLIINGSNSIEKEQRIIQVEAGDAKLHRLFPFGINGNMMMTLDLDSKAMNSINDGFSFDVVVIGDAPSNATIKLDVQ